MNKSESIKELAAALSKAQGELDHAKKDTSNPFFKSKYADLASVIDAAKKPLANNGLSVAQIVDMSESGALLLETILMHSSGEFISGRYPINPIKAEPQAIGSALTYARRYAFSAITGIAADDDDGNAASQQGNQKQAQQVDYKAAIESATTIEQLNSCWATIPHDVKIKLQPVATAQRIKLTQKEAA